MRIEGIIWLRDVVDKLISKHNVETYEVEEVLNGKPKTRFVEKGDKEGEDVYLFRKILGGVVHLQAEQRSTNFECPRYGGKGAETIWEKVNLVRGPNSPLSTR